MPDFRMPQVGSGNDDPKPAHGIIAAFFALRHQGQTLHA